MSASSRCVQPSRRPAVRWLGYRSFDREQLTAVNDSLAVHGEMLGASDFNVMTGHRSVKVKRVSVSRSAVNRVLGLYDELV